MTVVLYVIAGLAALYLCLKLGRELQVDDVERFFSNREAASDAEFGRRYFPECPEVAVKLRTLMAELLNADMSRLLPTDRPFDDALLGQDLGDVEFLMVVEDQFCITISDDDGEPVHTFADLVDCVQRLLQSESAA